MGVYAQTSKAWRGLEIGEKITSKQMVDKLGLGEGARPTVSGFLSREVSKGRAVKDGQLDGVVLYKKVGTAEGRKRKPSRVERELTDRDIGRAVLKAIDNLKEKLREERATVKELVEENRQLKELYKQAQTKILDLNQELQKRKPTREVKVSDLQDITK